MPLPSLWVKFSDHYKEKVQRSVNLPLLMDEGLDSLMAQMSPNMDIKITSLNVAMQTRHLQYTLRMRERLECET